MTQLLIDRATLEQLIESLETCSPGDYSTGYVIHPSFDAKAVDAAITAGRAALANAESTGCTWTKDPDFEMGDTYDSSCGEKWSFIDGGPTENRVSFCQGCGKPVKIVQDTL